jgi:hypothetical protein
LRAISILFASETAKSTVENQAFLHGRRKILGTHQPIKIASVVN